MATELANAYVALTVKMQGVQGAIAKELAPVSAEADKSGKRAGGKFGAGFQASVGKVGGLLAAGFAAVKVKDFLGDALGEARESQKVGALTAQVIKSTGGAAKISADEIGNLATAISNKTGVDDEAIQSGANLLLTFKNVKREGSGLNDVFGRATAASADLSAAGFGSIDSASKQLGKALNDPIKGIAALGRSGVTFTEDQKKLIAGFVEQGDMLSAQKIILGEVESQVGGAAEASATSGEKLAVAWGNFKETIGTALLPLIDKLATFLADKVIPAAVKLGPVISKVGGFIKSLFSGFSGDADGAGGKFSQFAATVQSVWANVKVIFTSAVSIVQSLWARFGGTIMGTIKGALSSVLTIIRGAFTVVRGIFVTVSALLKGDWSGVWNGIKTILRGAWTAIKGIVNLGWTAIKGAFRAAGSAIKGIFSGIWNGVKSLAKKGIDSVVGAVKALPGKIRDIGGKMASAGKALADRFMNGLKNIAGKAGDIARGLWNGIKGFLNSAISKINGAIPNKIGKGKLSIDLPDNPFPRFAKGGYIPPSAGGTLGVLAEAGEGEFVVPESKMRSLLGAVSAAGAASADGPGVTDLSDETIQRLAAAILIGARAVSIGVADQREYRDAVKSRVPGAFAGDVQ